jgi:hypothetical protein
MHPIHFHGRSHTKPVRGGFAGGDGVILSEGNPESED